MSHMRPKVQPFCPRRRLLLASGALTLLLPGCVRALFRREEPPPPEERPPVDVVARWRALGKLAARTGDGNWSASLDWRQADEDFRLRLSGPFGQGALQVEGSPGNVELTTARGERRSAPTPEALLAQELDWDLPASSLRHWITARAHPGVPVESWTLDEAGRLASLAQQGWRLDYVYRGDPNGHSLPDRITLRGEGVVLRIAIRDWRID